MSTLIATTLQGINTIKYDANTTAINVNSAGVVTQPTKPMFRVKQSSDQSISHATDTVVQFNNLSHAESFNVGGYFNTSNYRYVPQVAGYYWFGATVTMRTAVPDYVVVTIRKNGVNTYRNLGMESNAQNAHVPAHTSGVIYMNGSTDYADVIVYHNTGSAINTNSNFEYSNFNGYLVS